MNYRKRLLLFALLSFQLSIASAQSVLPYRSYQTTLYNDNQARQGKQHRVNMQAVRHVARYDSKEEDWEELVVPLVFHVLGTDFDLPLTPDLIEDQVDRLNEDFAGAFIPETDPRDVNDQFLIRGTDTRISFCYAVTKKSTAPVINFLTVEEDELRQLDSLRVKAGAAPALDPNKYVNVWVVPDRFVATGFAQYPGGERKLDGIVISRTYFGVGPHNNERFDRGRTLTHLMGNYLGLRPLWGGDGPCGDDGVTDTPVHNAPNFGRPRPYHYSTCGDTTLEMTMNFMDNVADDQMYLFTRGQARLMRAILSDKGPRKQLLKTATRCSLIEKRSLTLEQFASGNSENSGDISLEDVVVSPNPATHTLTVALNLSGAAVNSLHVIRIVDLQGRLMYKRSALPSHTTLSVPVAEWSRGTYLLSVYAATSQAAVTQRIILQ
ncbi:M43 family zinc metalloprotease [Neolewinella sp.]|uniref:M43 family zinc metalloprotease n=1 Tax=Neolewinella sp. TaxID=2993543 RepID=UPI003B52714B